MNTAFFPFRALVLVWGIAWMSPSVVEGGVPANTLSRFVEGVTQRHPSLRAAQAKVQEAEAGLRETEYQRLPMLSARSSFTRGDHPVFVFGSLMEQGRFGPNNFAISALNNPSDLTNIKSGLDLGVPLFTGLELTSAVHQRELAARQAKEEWSGLAQRVRLQAAMSYLEALMVKATLKDLDDRLVASREEVNDAKRLKERGVVLGSDYFAALAVYNGLSSWRVELANRARNAESRLAILAGQPAVTVAGELRDVSPALPPEPEWVRQALLQRPDMTSASLQVEQADLGAKQAGRTVWPRVEGFASLETNTNDFESNPSNHLFGVAAKLPFGDPAYFARRSRVASSRSAAREGRQNAEDMATIEISEAYHGYQAAQDSLPIVKEMTANAEESLRLFRPLYRSGRQSILEVLRAEDALAKTRAAYWQSLFRLHAGYLQLKAASGQLDEAAVRELGERLEAKP